jgi:hypothetical protein
MVHESMKNLQFDRRLQGRRGWVSESDTQSHIENLPDVAAKGEVIADADEAAAPEPLRGAAPARAVEPPSGD